MLRAKLFILLFIVFVVEAQYRRPPLRPRPIPSSPATLPNVIEIDPVTEPSTSTPAAQPSIANDEKEVFTTSTQLPGLRPIITRPSGSLRPPARPRPTTRPLLRPNRPIPSKPASPLLPNQMNVTGDRTESPGLVIVYPESSETKETGNYVPDPNFSKNQQDPPSEPKPMLPPYVPEIELQPEPEIEPEPPTYEPKEESQPEAETGFDPEAKPEPPIYDPEVDFNPEAHTESPTYAPEMEIKPESESLNPEEESQPGPETEFDPEGQPKPPNFNPEIEPQPGSETEFDPEAQPELPTFDPEVEPEAGSETEFDPEAQPELPTYDPEVELDSGFETEFNPETQPELPTYNPEVEPQPGSESEFDPEAQPELTTYAPEVKPEAGSETEFDPEAQPELPTYDPDVEPQPGSETEFIPETQPELPTYDSEGESESGQSAPPTSPPDAIPNDVFPDMPDITTRQPIEPDTDAKPEPKIPELKPFSPSPEIPTPRPTPSPTPNYGRPQTPSTSKPIYQTPKPVRPTRPTIPPYRPSSPSKYPNLSKPIGKYVCVQADAYYPIARECDTYVECRKSVARKFMCPDGLLFNPKAHWPEYPCVYPSQVICGNKTIMRAPMSSGECPRQFGTFPGNTGDCGKFVVCHDGRATLMTCPTGLAFNPRTSGCDWPEKVPACNPNVFQGFTCPAPPKGRYGGLSEQVYNYRYQSSCKEYIACLKGQPRLLRCDTGLSFDEVSGRCISSDAVTNCGTI